MDTLKPVEDTPPPLPRAISFPAGNDDFRAARNRCARACQAFNETPEDAEPEIRCERWLDIVSPNRPPPCSSSSSSSDPTPFTTLDMTFGDPTLVPAAPFVKPPLHMDYGLRVRVGGSTFINRYCMIMDTPVADVVIGERCNVGPHCAILSVGHPVAVGERTAKRTSIGREVRIGDGVWIGARVTIMGGVTIGDGAVIGACSLVTRSIPPRALAYGVPAEVVRILDDDEKADAAEEAASVQTLEEALKLPSQETDTPTTTTTTTTLTAVPPAAAHVESGADMAKSAAAASLYQRPCRNRSQQHLGVRDSHGMTRAEILALVALAVSFMGCFFLVALVVAAKWEADLSYPRVRDL